MIRKSDAKFWKKRSCSFKYDMRNLLNFHPATQKCQNLFLMGSFCAKYARLEPQKDRGVAFYDTEQWCKMWISPYLMFSKMAWGIGLTFIRALKSLKNYTLMRYFCLKCMFQLENFIGILCRETEQWCKIYRKTDSWLAKWHKEFG